MPQPTREKEIATHMRIRFIDTPKMKLKLTWGGKSYSKEPLTPKL
jgi:hypothetical protein